MHPIHSVRCNRDAKTLQAISLRIEGEISALFAALSAIPDRWKKNRQKKRTDTAPGAELPLTGSCAGSYELPEIGDTTIWIGKDLVSNGYLPASGDIAAARQPDSNRPAAVARGLDFRRMGRSPDRRAAKGSPRRHRILGCPALFAPVARAGTWELRASERTIRLLFNANPHPRCVFDRQTGISER